MSSHPPPVDPPPQDLPSPPQLPPSPPENSPPQLPPSEQEHSPPQPSSPALPPPPLHLYFSNKPNTLIIKFLRLLSVIISLSGALAGVTLYLYHKWILPKLSAHHAIILQLINVHETLYTKLLKSFTHLAETMPFGPLLSSPSSLMTESIKDNVKSDSKSIDERLSSPNPQPQPPKKINIELTSIINNLQSLSKSTTSFVQQRSNHHSFSSNMNEKLSLSIIGLEDEAIRLLAQYPSSLGPLGSNSYRNPYLGSPLPPPPASLPHEDHKNLNHVNDNNQSEASQGGLKTRVSVPVSLPAPASAVDPSTNLIAEIKNEIRSLKGMMLNRKNFASWHHP